MPANDTNADTDPNTDADTDALPAPPLDPVLARLDARADVSVERLLDLLRIPSISTDPAHDADCDRAAAWLRDDLESIGFEARVIESAGRAFVVGRHPGPGGGADVPHVLFYGHYDVQPVDPLHEWHHPPFEPRVEGGAIRARGASDDKGQLMTFVEAARAHVDETGTLPVRVTVLFEGEEESGSPSLPAFLKEYGNEITADVALVCDTVMWDSDTPAISSSLRGLVGEEVTVTAADRDLHSGHFGGAAANPIHILAAMMAGLHDGTGRVTLAGFYDGVPELTEETRAEWASLGGDLLGPIGLSEVAGEDGYTAIEATWARPTAEVNGIIGGYTGEGFKTVIPSKASAKVSFRLVGDQDPDAVREAFRAHCRAMLPTDCGIEFHPHGGGPGITVPTDSAHLRAARAALSDEWPNPALTIGMGGSIPIVNAFKGLGMDTLLIGFALEGDRIHSPNEKYDLRSFLKGQRSWARVLAALAAGVRP